MAGSRNGSFDDGFDDIEEGGTGAAGQPSFLQRLSTTFLKPPKPDRSEEPVDPRKLTNEQLRVRLNRLDPTERRVGQAAAGLAAVAALARYVPHIVHNTPIKTTAKPHGHACPTHLHFVAGSAGHAAQCTGFITYTIGSWVFPMIILLVLAVGLAGVIWLNRRAALAFTLLITGLAAESAIGIFGFVFLVAGGWLMVRAYRVERYGSPTAKRPDPDLIPARELRPQRGGAKSSRATRPAAARPGRGATTAKSDSARRTPTPAASKRYTPKEPPRPSKAAGRRTAAPSRRTSAPSKPRSKS